MVRDYELMYIVRPDVDDDGLRTAVDSVKTLIEGQGGEITKTTMWGKRRLAYEVAHLRDGHYVIVEMRLEGARVAPVERALRIHDNVFRHLLVVQEAPGAGIEGEGEVLGAAQDGASPAATAEAAPAAEAGTVEPAAEAKAEVAPDAELDIDDDAIPAAADADEEE